MPHFEAIAFDADDTLRHTERLYADAQARFRELLALGAHAVHVPYALTWAHEAASPPLVGTPGFYELGRLGLLPGLLAELERCVTE